MNLRVSEVYSKKKEDIRWQDFFIHKNTFFLTNKKNICYCQLKQTVPVANITSNSGGCKGGDKGDISLPEILRKTTNKNNTVLILIRDCSLHRN